MTILAVVTPSTETTDKGYSVGAHGLSIDRPLSLNEWLDLGRRLAANADGTRWAIGDWLAYGDGRGDYGLTYEHAAQITGRSYETLSQYLRVSREFMGEDRDALVVWSFYREALRLPAGERVRTLHLAAANAWTRDDLANYINGRGDAPLTKGAHISDSHRPTPKTWQRRKNHRKMLTCPQCGHVFEQQSGLK